MSNQLPAKPNAQKPPKPSSKYGGFSTFNLVLEVLENLIYLIFSAENDFNETFAELWRRIKAIQLPKTKGGSEPKATGSMPGETETVDNVASTNTTSKLTLVDAANLINVNALGYFLDGWADLIEGWSEKAEEVRSKVFEGLKDRQMPLINTFEKQAHVISKLALAFQVETSNERRPYILNTTSPGATTTVYVGEHGKDLYVAWRTFIHPVLNWGLLLFVFIISAFLGLISGGRVDETYSDGFYSYTNTGFSSTGWLEWTIGFFVFACILIAIASLIVRGNAFIFFFKEPTVFDAEDITAMSLSAHKSILRALDSTGFDVTKLRLKQSFKGGRRGEDM